MYCIGEKAELKEDVLDVQSRSMRDNLLFHGVPECDSFDQRKEEKCDEKIINLCDQTLHIENAGNIKIERAHRMGRYTAGRTRPIVVKFNHYPDKVRVSSPLTPHYVTPIIGLVNNIPRKYRSGDVYYTRR